MKKKVPVSFTTRARLLNQLGEQLIKSEDIALLELIKNAYDADATYCHVTMENLTEPKTARIIISDDGCGMDVDTIEHAWLEIGTSNKEDLAADVDTRRTPKFKRMRLGEKGIGRFGVHRLGRKIELISKMGKSKFEVHLSIDWTKADEVKLIEDVPVLLWKSEPEMFTGDKTGTYIVISDLRGTWDRGNVREIARTIATLNSPFAGNDEFSATLKLSGRGDEAKWLDGVVTFSTIKERSLYSFDITMSGNSVTSFTYDFKPWKVLNLLTPRHVSWGRNGDNARMVETIESADGKRYIKDIDVSAIGAIRFQGVIFDLDPRILKLGVQDKRGFKRYLQDNGGVRVYRDNMRVLNYGERGDDWLDLNFRRVNEPGNKISLNVIIAAVSLSRDDSSSLVEKANREGFIKNVAFDKLRSAVLYALGLVEAERNIDKDAIRAAYGQKAERTSVRASMADLRVDIGKYVKNASARKKMLHCIDRVEEDYEEFANSLIKSAGAGLNLAIVIHQMEKIIKNVQSALKKRKCNDTIARQIESLSRLVEGYSILVKDSECASRDLSVIVEQSVFDVGFRLKAHKITIEEAYKKRGVCNAVCAEGHAVGALLNLFDNSIWWLGYSQTCKPKIFVDIVESSLYPHSMVLVVADNGPGFSHEPVQDLVKPFVTFKPNGMGIGLHLTDETMKAMGGRLEFPSPADLGVPKEYADGATIALVFPKETK